MERVIAFSMKRVIAFSIEHVLVQNALPFHRNFGVPAAFPQRSRSVPAAFHFAFQLRSNNTFTVRLLLSGTVFRPEINIFELICCVKLTCCCFLSEIKVLAVTRQGEINILTYLGLKSTFLSLYLA